MWQQDEDLNWEAVQVTLSFFSVTFGLEPSGVHDLLNLHFYVG